MKRFIFYIIIAFVSIVYVSQASSIATTSNEEVIVYDGGIDSVRMNGELKNPIKNLATSISTNTDGTINLNLPPFKVGKMPGSIAIDAKGIKVDDKGEFNAMVKKSMLFKMLFETKYDTKIVGRIVADTLVYSVATIDAKYVGVGIDTKMQFLGIVDKY